MKRLVLAVLAALSLVAMPLTASADNPFAGNSGHFKGSAQPCPQNEQKCPPQSP
jgi:hypothetical protein